MGTNHTFHVYLNFRRLLVGHDGGGEEMPEIAMSLLKPRLILTPYEPHATPMFISPHRFAYIRVGPLSSFHAMVYGYQ